MAYIKPNMSVFFVNGNKHVISTVTKVSFRKYWGAIVDKKTGKKVKKHKSMPFACCRVLYSSDPTVSVGEEFLIAGYKLQNAIVKDEKGLTFKGDFAAEYAKEYGNEWVRRIIDGGR